MFLSFESPQRLVRAHDKGPGTERAEGPGSLVNRRARPKGHVSIRLKREPVFPKETLHDLALPPRSAAASCHPAALCGGFLTGALGSRQRPRVPRFCSVPSP